MSDLAWCMASADSPEHVRAMRGRSRELIELILAHAAREDLRLLPLVAEHRETLVLSTTGAGSPIRLRGRAPQELLLESA